MTEETVKEAFMREIAKDPHRWQEAPHAGLMVTIRAARGWSRWRTQGNILDFLSRVSAPKHFIVSEA
jgi:hypothetical protein